MFETSKRIMYPILFIGLSLLVFIPAAFYLFSFFRKFMTLFGGAPSSVSTRIVAVICTAACIAAGWHVYNFRGIIVTLLFILLLADELVNFIICRCPLPSGYLSVWSVIYRSGAIPAAACAVIILCGYIRAVTVRPTTYTVYTDKQLERPVTIALISDLHMGVTMSPEKLASYCREIESYRPDYLMLAGDIFDENTRRSVMEQTVAVLSHVQTAYGTYFVFGNHEDNAKTKKQQYTVAELHAVIKASGIRMLEDEAVCPSADVTIIGRNDRNLNPSRHSVAALIPPDRKHTLLILLDHQPWGISDSASAGIDLQLSGHTHAGQIWPTGPFGRLFRHWDFTYGVLRRGAYTLIVSSGMGAWSYPVRLASRSEYVVVTVRSKQLGN